MAQAVGAVIGLATGMASLSAQKKAQKAAQKQQELADMRERRKLLRAAQIQKGTVTNYAGQVGALGSTAVAGGLSGLTNQVQSQIGYQSQSSQLANLQSKYLMKANTWNMIGDIGMGFAKALG